MTDTKPEAACPCQSPPLCILCSRSEPCGLLGPDGTGPPICTMEPEGYAELVERVRAAYHASALLRAQVRELEADKARLDWLETQVSAGMGIYTAGPDSRGRVMIARDTDPRFVRGETLREAIDKARG